MKTGKILGVNICITDMRNTIDTIAANIDAWRGKYICITNVHTTIMAHDDENYMKIQNGSILTLPDGAPLSAYLRKHGYEDARRVAGPDLMHEILKISAEHGWKHFFYGSTDETLELLNKAIQDKYPGVVVSGMVSPPFRTLTEEEDKEYIDMINAAKPDFVWVGLGAPKQEIWMAEHEDKIDAIMLGVGAAFNFEAGNVKRAPKWMQKLSLEWLFRLSQDPKRLFKRYLITNTKYMWLTRK